MEQNINLLLKIKTISENRYAYLENCLNEISLINDSHNSSNDLYPIDCIDTQVEVENYLIKQNFIHLIEQKNIIIEKNKIKDYIESINNKIKKLCIHETIDDYIDIDVDTSKNISYCIKCNLTF
jgi:hypothetical protein